MEPPRPEKIRGSSYMKASGAPAAIKYYAGADACVLLLCARAPGDILLFYD
jgi:hypothetical protein